MEYDYEMTAIWSTTFVIYFIPREYFNKLILYQTCKNLTVALFMLTIK